jgi:hypothetical protein
MNNLIPRWVIWDETGEYMKEQIGYWCNTIPQLVESKRNPRLTYYTEIPDRKIEMEKFCFACWKLFQGRGIIIEECDLYFHPRGLPRYGLVMLMQGSHRDMMRIFIAKRIHTVNQSVVANARLLVLFQIDHERDIQTLKQFLGRDKEERKENIETVMNLEKYHYVIWDRETRQLTKFKPLPLKTK